ncbi:aldo/keto reductase family oxidoreductase [Niveibacterium umoris]|uniref:Putative oxidoreductase n=1 Tax=Niveibacterium umoris TaxID=1193620 RepID=A0A840BCA3_9RHOO|nr:aldo/keto reductase [Niveibacterium umoris]MBB4011171.1 putative oxidoreductase [Niveibacterium umoris]
MIASRYFGKMSPIALGTWRMHEWGMSSAELASFLQGAVEAGVTTIDTADVYCNYGGERMLGDALRRSPDLRDRIQLVTKCGVRLKSSDAPASRVKHYDCSRAYVIQQVERSLQSLSTDRIDLLLLHRPDPLLDADELAEVFCALKQSGKVRSFGVSNFRPQQLELLQSRLPFPLVVNQIELSLMRCSPMFDGTLDQCQKMRIVPMAWSPLAGGRLLSSDARNDALEAVLSAIAGETGLTPEQVALCWLMRHPAGIVPVIGSGKLERVRLAIDAASYAMDRQHWFELLEAATGCEVA